MGENAIKLLISGNLKEQNNIILFTLNKLSFDLKFTFIRLVKNRVIFYKS